MTARKATLDEIDEFITTHTNWIVEDGKLQRIFTFRSFRRRSAL